MLGSKNAPVAATTATKNIGPQDLNVPNPGTDGVSSLNFSQHNLLVSSNWDSTLDHLLLASRGTGDASTGDSESSRYEMMLEVRIVVSAYVGVFLCDCCFVLR